MNHNQHTTAEIFAKLDELFWQVLDKIQAAKKPASLGWNALAIFKNFAEVAVCLNRPGIQESSLEDARMVLQTAKDMCHQDVTGFTANALHPVLSYIEWQLAEHQ